MQPDGTAGSKFDEYGTGITTERRTIVTDFVFADFPHLSRCQPLLVVNVAEDVFYQLLVRDTRITRRVTYGCNERVFIDGVGKHDRLRQFSLPRRASNAQVCDVGVAGRCNP